MVPKDFLKVEWFILLISIIFAALVVFLNLPQQDVSLVSTSEFGSQTTDADNLIPALEPTKQKEELLPGPLEVKERKVLAENLFPNKIIYFTNLEREKIGLPALNENILLNEAAKQKNLDMSKNQYFDHISPQGASISDFVDKIDYQYLTIGENLALGDFSNEKEVVVAWMASQGHKENILNSKFKEIGMSIQKSFFKGKETFLIVQVFARPISDCPLPDTNLALLIDKQHKEINNLQKEIDNLRNEIENLQQEAEKIYQEGQGKIQEGVNLIEEGNDLIEKGDRIYQETKDKEEAEKYWEDGKKLQKEGQEIISLASDKYNQKLKDTYSLINEKTKKYNSLISQLENKISKLNKNTQEYNNQIAQFNQCVSQ